MFAHSSQIHSVIFVEACGLMAASTLPQSPSPLIWSETARQSHCCHKQAGWAPCAAALLPPLSMCCEKHHSTLTGKTGIEVGWSTEKNFLKANAFLPLRPMAHWGLVIVYATVLRDVEEFWIAPLHPVIPEFLKCFSKSLKFSLKTL